MQALDQSFRGKPDKVTDIIIGMSDGFIVPFAVTVGLYSSGAGRLAIIAAGFTIAIAGGLAMGLSRFFAAREDAAHEHELMEEHDKEVFDRIGLNEHTQQVIFGEMARDKVQWQELMDANELKAEEFKAGHSRISGLYIGLSYAVAGLIPVLPYLFTQDRSKGCLYVAVLTTFFLFAFGFFKGKAMGIHAWGSAVRVMVTGLVLALAAWFLGGIFS